ncbi:MAG: transcriptional repressor [Alphaproteobacteria bacterium]|jgi:Fur family ferric uptake transcriptional regulator|nr:transcriptional repressor [Alphaproteobacteria bacterium]PPR14132.1 MAG: Ferric uptake regulation protein [Alphaproteobacteria bacterium MarineAlpha12_Bin1]|tara:strand:- start:5863 stop:6303 length:441 start_codon:yes stop_codon:yes gene_type:complete
MLSRIEQICSDKGLKMTDQRRIIAQVLSESIDHPDVDLVYRRATELDPRISIATVYRTLRLFEEANILEKHDFGDGRARYEEASGDHHDHLINIKTGEVVEFYNQEIEAMKQQIAKDLGFELVDHRLELYATPSVSNESPDDDSSF